VKKIVYYEPAGRIHSGQWDLINNPPEGYEFVTKKISPIVNNNFIFDKLRLQLLDRLMPLNLAKAKLDSLLSMPEADMIYAYNHVVFRKIPWVVHCEWAHILVGRDLRFFPRYKERVEELLSSSYCKGIITLSTLARESILRNYDTTNFINKIEIIPTTVKHTNYNRNYNRDSVNLLFVGSINTPEDFNAKGAADVIKAFGILKTEHKSLKLTVRAKAPKNIDGIPGLTIIDHIISKYELQQLFRDADIFVHPAHLPTGMAIIEAMSYGLPIVTSWMGSACGEYVKDGINGLVLSKNDVSYFTDNLMLTSETIHRHKLFKHATNDLDSLVSALEQLITNPNLRKRLGRNAKAEVDVGRFSIEHRNKLLKEMFDA